jgi:hypothetical protein
MKSHTESVPLKEVKVGRSYLIERAKIKVLQVLRAMDSHRREVVNFSFSWDSERYYVTGTIGNVA